MSKLDEDFSDALYDWIPDKDERESVVGHLKYYARQHHKSIFISGVIAGFFAAVLLLKWLA
jgi:hypothetical protein